MAQSPSGLDGERALLVSGQSARLTTSMTMQERQAAQAAQTQLYLIKPDEVSKIWSAADPNVMVQKLILHHCEDVQADTGEDWRSWDQYEDRFEAGELKWIADYVVRNMCFVKNDLQVQDDEGVCHILQVLWKTLNLLNNNTSTVLHKETQSRYEILNQGLRQIFEQRVVTKDQVKKILDYTKRTIFGHMQLYLTCIGQKKQAAKVKRVEIFTEVPKMSEPVDLETNCREILEEGRSATPEMLLAGETAVGDEDGSVQEGKEEEEEDIVDPNDPLYGIDARLAQLELDEESRAVLKAKLIDASKKIQEGLEKRQSDLDTKLAAMPANQKRR